MNTIEVTLAKVSRRGQRQTSTARHKRMSQGNGTTVGVDKVGIIWKTTLATEGERLSSEGFDELYDAEIDDPKLQTIHNPS